MFDHLIENQHLQQQMSWNLEMEHTELYGGTNIVSQNSVIANPAVVYQADRQVSDGSTDSSCSGNAYEATSFSCRSMENIPPLNQGLYCDVDNCHDCPVQEITFN